jgi:predicted secreted protein
MQAVDRLVTRLSGPAQVGLGLLAAFCGIGIVLAVLYLRSGQLIFSLGTSVAIYFVIWWLTLFAVLPFRVRSQVEAGEIEAGSDPGAPHQAHLLWYALVTSAVATMLSLMFLIWIAPLI